MQVTVPILLSLGVGVMKAQRERRQLQQVLEDAAVKQGEGELITWRHGLMTFTAVCVAAAAAGAGRCSSQARRR
jgi:hypothetical protein